jgi:hypothetical protein
MRKIRDTKNRKLDIRTHVFRVRVARLMFTPGEKLGVKVRSEDISCPVTPS